MFYIKSIELSNFRCYESFKTEFSPNINIITGNNAVGKTSLVEAIYFLGVCKSFKTSDDNELIRSGKDCLYVKGTLFDDDKQSKIVASLSDKGKRVIVNEKKYKTLSDYLGFLNIVSFSPSDLRIIKGEPRIKRRFLDVNIGQIDKNYLMNIINYNKVLKERNELLKNYESYPRSEELLYLYTSKLISLGKEIIIRRNQFLKELEPHINMKLKEISALQEEINVYYKPNVYVEDIEKEFNAAVDIDKNAKTTTKGPHKDDIIFNLNNMDASVYGSQGQQRSIALAVKLGLADYIKKINEKIIIILDDVFGELDLNRQNQLLQAVCGDSQVFITTTDASNVNKEIMNKSKVIKIEDMVKENG